MKTILLPNNETIELILYDQQADLSGFITINGSDLKHLKICVDWGDYEILGRCLQSIGQYCQNLVKQTVNFNIYLLH